MAEKSIRKNAAFNVMKTAMSMLFPLITFPYASRILSPEGIGKVNFANSIVAYFTLIAGLPCALILIKNWKNQVFCAVAPDIAAGENISPQHQNRLFTVLIAVFVALSFKTTGLLLVSALTVIPACAARFISKTPEQMAVKASFIGLICSVSGIALSVFANAPAAPAIELTCAFCFVLCGFWHFCHKNDI